MIIASIIISGCAIVISILTIIINYCIANDIPPPRWLQGRGL